MGDDHGHEKTDHDFCRDSAVRFNFLFLSPNGRVSGIYYPLQSAMVQGFLKQLGQSLKTRILSNLNILRIRQNNGGQESEISLTGLPVISEPGKRLGSYLG